MAQQTAVEWFIEQLPMRIVNMYHKEIEQAKQMEKEQIINAFIDGEFMSTGMDKDAYIYYNEKYGK